jgi:hypothetical protein
VQLLYDQVVSVVRQSGQAQLKVNGRQWVVKEVNSEQGTTVRGVSPSVARNLVLAPDSDALPELREERGRSIGSFAERSISTTAMAEHVDSSR